MTHTSSTARINKAIRAAGLPHVTLRGGRGYQFFVFNDGVLYDTRSEMVCYVRDLSVDEWVALAQQFAREVC